MENAYKMCIIAERGKRKAAEEELAKLRTAQATAKQKLQREVGHRRERERAGDAAQAEEQRAEAARAEQQHRAAERAAVIAAEVKVGKKVLYFL